MSSSSAGGSTSGEDPSSDPAPGPTPGPAGNPSPEPGPDDGSPNRPTPQVGRRRFEHIHAWVSSLAALTALAFSLYNFISVQRQPDTDVTLPHIVRISQGADVWFYLQPTLSTRVESTQAEVIPRVDLRMYPSNLGSRKPTFFWDESGAFTYDPTQKTLNYDWKADPSPLLVSRDKPQQPLMLFTATSWNFSAGNYEGRLTLHREGSNKPLTADFCLTLSTSAINSLRSHGQNSWIGFRDDVPEARAKGCYILT